MKSLRNILMVVVVLVFVGNAFGATVYTTYVIGGPTSGTIYELASQAGNNACSFMAWTGENDAFTVDGSYRDDVWAIVLSEIDGQFIINGLGYPGSDGTYGGFEFKLFGDSTNPVVPAYKVIFIIDDGDGVLLWIDNGSLLLGSAIGGTDIILGQECVSINGGSFGDISEVVFNSSNGSQYWTSIELVTPPVILASPENGTSGIDPNTSLIWDGNDASEFNVYLYDDQGGPVFVFSGLTEESLDVNGYLDWKTTYNWQVDEVIGGVVTYSSPVWTFTTINYECQSILVGDWNGDCVVNFVDFAMMANNWLVETPKVPMGSGG